METSVKKSYKIIVIGESNVGKTCLTYRFCDGKYEALPSITIGMDFRCRKLDINGERIMLQLWDTAGLEKHRRSMVSHYYRNVDAVVIVYDVTCRKSFDNLQHWIDECGRHALTDPIRVLVGNKCDMEPAVGRNEAQRFADANGMPLFETSAKLDSEYNNIEAIFLTLAHKLVHQQPMAVVPDVVDLGTSENTSASGTRWWTCWLF